MELADRGVRVNTVNPGPIETAALKKQASDLADIQRVLDAEISRVPLHRLGQPAEVAEAILFLASDRASFVRAVNCSSTAARGRPDVYGRGPLPSKPPPCGGDRHSDTHLPAWTWRSSGRVRANDSTPTESPIRRTN